MAGLANNNQNKGGGNGGATALATRPPVHLAVPGAGGNNNTVPARNQNQGGALTQRDILTERAKTMLDPENYKQGRSLYRPVAENVRTLAGDILPVLARSLNFGDEHSPQLFVQRLYAHTRDLKISLSELLEMLDPSSQYAGTPEGELTAFERQLLVCGIRTHSDPKRKMFADTLQRFEQSNVPGSPALFPEFVDLIIRAPMLAADIISEILAITTPVNGSDYRSIYLNDTAEQRRMKRVVESADIPKTTITTSEKSIPVKKYALGLGMTYEAMRRLAIDKFELFLRRVQQENMLSKATDACYTLVNGDGNSNPATNYNQSTLDTGTTMTYKAFLAFAMRFYPYQLNTLIGNETSLVNFLTLARPSVDPFQILSVLQNQQTVNQRVELRQGIFTNVNLILLPDMTDGVMLGLDRDYALEQVNEIGSNIVDIDKYARNQTQEMFMSENMAWAKVFNEAARTWTWNA
jgi:hypothetical protein